MKKMLLFATLVGFFAFNLCAQEPIRDYHFKFTIKNLPDSVKTQAFLANYYGSKQYYNDTTDVAENGVIEFRGDSIMGGIYSVILSDRKSIFEFVLNEPKIEMETDFKDLVKNMNVVHSKENTKFYEYLDFIQEKGKEAEPLRKIVMDTAITDAKKVGDAEQKLKVIDDAVINYKKQFISENPGLFITKVFKATAEPEIGEFEHIEDEEERKKQRYYEFKRQYLKDVDFSDERLLRTPVLHQKFIYYLTKLTPQQPDSINAAADYLVKKARPNKEVFKYVVHTITSKYEQSKIMGMEAVVVHMGKNYYCNGDAYWLSEKKLKDFCEQISKWEPLLIGKKAPNITLQDTAGKWHVLYNVEAPYTVVYFWDSGCGHCKKVTPKLKEFYEKYHPKGVEVFAVGTELETKDWKDYIRKNKLPWINVSDTPELPSNFRDTWDIFSTPKVFLLDKDKKIIAVKLMPEQLGEFLDHEMGESNDMPYQVPNTGLD